MPTLQFDRFRIEFPYEPYECQVSFMEKMISALEQGKNAALESPTGTGKTLCLLCAAIAYVKDCKTRITLGAEELSQGTSSKSLYPKVLYASRTHSQLTQVIRELNKTTYKDIRTVTLASRDLLCINESVMKETNSNVKSLMCRALVGKRRCHYYNVYDKADPAALDLLYSQNGNVPDIEDIVNTAKRLNHCPFYRTRSLYETADLILLPYNYIVDPRLRRAHDVDIKGNIIIFDEAHNLESICEEATSISLSSAELSGCIRETKVVLEMLLQDIEENRTKMDNSSASFGSENQVDKPTVEKNDLAYLLSALQQLETAVDELPKMHGNILPRINGKVFPASKMAEFLTEAGFRREMRESIATVIDKVGQYLTSKGVDAAKEFSINGTYLQHFASFISVVFAETCNFPSAECVPSSSGSGRFSEDTSKCFHLYVTQVETTITLNYWCFSPSVAMWYLYSRGVRSVIFTSGTLSPINSFVNTLGIEVPVILENEHVAHADQLVAVRINKDLHGQFLCGNFANRNESYIRGVGETVERLCRIIPEGLLVFFSSYSVMNTCFKSWKITGVFDKGENTRPRTGTIWDRISNAKQIFVEPKSKVDLRSTLLQYRLKVKEANGAVLFAVCRGKISEGIDFSDSESRGVVVVGVPFAPPTEPRVELKKQYLSSRKAAKKSSKDSISADEWYQIDAIRAINQAIGRVLRHKDDFGAVVLLDSRLCAVPPKRFPSWIRRSLKTVDSVLDFERDCREFFVRRGMSVMAVDCFVELPANQTVVTDSSRKRPMEHEQSSIFCTPDFFSIENLKSLYSSEAIAAFKSMPSAEIVEKRSRGLISELETSSMADDATVPPFPNRVEKKPLVRPSTSASKVSRRPMPKLVVKANPGSTVFGKTSASAETSTSPVTSQMSVMEKWRKTAKEFGTMLKGLDSVKRNHLRQALLCYQQNEQFSSLMSSFAADTLPQNPEIFKGLYGFLRKEHIPLFADECRRSRLFDARRN